MEQGTESTIDKLFAANGLAYGLGDTNTAVHGPEEIKPFVRNVRTALPDLRITIEDLIAEGDQVAVRVVLEGTHSGTGLGIPPSGRRVKIRGMVLVRVFGEQLVEGWNNWDQLGLLRQIGALPIPANDQFLIASS